MATTTRRSPLLILLSLVACATVAAADPAPPAGPGQRGWPVWFEPAARPADGYFALGAGQPVWLSTDGVRISLEDAPVQLTFDGARRVAPRAERPGPGVSHHFLGNDPSAWRRAVPHFGAVRYPQVYPGIDVLFYAAQDETRATRLEYDFEVAPGADPDAIAVRLTGIPTLTIDDQGQLVARRGAHAVVQRRPVAFQHIDGERRDVDVAFAIDEDVIRFRLGDYDRRHPLTIDPIVVVFGTFVGGAGAEFVEVGAENGGIALDAQGSVYVAGDTSSPSLDLGGPTTVLGVPNVFVVKLNATGSAVEYATFVGGSGDDTRARLVLAQDGAVFVSGRTTSTNFPTTADPIKATPPTLGNSDGFLVRLDATGALTYGTYLGGAGIDTAEGLAVRGTTVAVVGFTSSGDLHVTGNAAQPSRGGAAGDFDAWLAVVETSPAPTLAYGTYVGGGSTDAAFAVGFDTTGRVLVSGLTDSSDFPVSPSTALQTTRRGARDAFLARFVPSTGARDYATYFGGTGTLGESATRLAVDAQNRVHVAGVSDSTDLPAGLATPFQAGNAGGFDAFVAKLDLEATPAQQLLYRTYLGGTANDAALAMTLDALGRVTIGGYTLSANFPVADALQGTKGAAEDGFVARLSASGSALDFSTFVGGGGTDLVLGLAHRSGFGLYALGQSASTAPLPLRSAGGGPPLDGTLGGTSDAFVARLDVGPLAASIAPASGATTGGTPVTITGIDFAPGATVTIGGTAATGIVVTDSTTIAAVTPPGPAGARDVVVTNPNGSASTLAGAFTYVAPGAAPTLTSVAPNQGVILGGQQVQLTGTGFVTGATVFFGTTPATGVVVQSPTTIQATTPARGPGAVAVSVVNPDLQSGTLSPGFTYLADFDGDGIDDVWERDNGLDPTSPGDAGLDPDNDGASNRREFQDGTDPNTAVTRFFAEGATGPLFSTRFALLNDDETREATVTIEFLVKDGPVLSATRTILPRRRLTIDAASEIPGLGDAAFSTSIRSNLPIAADRTMTWDRTTYGAHSETAVAAPASTWYLAEGATIAGLNLFYLIQNPNPVEVAVTVRYLLSSGPPVQKTYTVGPRTRENIWVNFETVQGVSLNEQQLSAVLTTSASTPIIVERAMYLDANGQLFGAGHESAGITQPGTQWLLAEGATGPFFDLFVLLANPGSQPANVTATYLLPQGAPVVKTYVVDPNSRRTVWVNLEPELTATPVSTIVNSDVPIIVERAMWWPALPAAWYEAHNSPGAQGSSRRWVVAEGEVGAFNVLDSYILLANTTARAGVARVTLLFEDATAPVVREFALGANSRTNVRVGFDIGDATLVGKRFGAVIESVGSDPVDLVVERAMYWTPGGRFYEAGTNALGTRR